VAHIAAGVEDGLSGCAVGQGDGRRDERKTGKSGKLDTHQIPPVIQLVHKATNMNAP
jgi:hypothetical protein